MSITLMHYFHAETSTVQQVGPGIHHMPFARSDGLVEVEAVEVERHGGDAEGGKPDTHDRPGSEEEVQ